MKRPRDLEIDLSAAKVLTINLAALAPPEAAQALSAGSRTNPLPRYTKPGEDGMNKTERRYSVWLEDRRHLGEIYRWDFEPEKFRLANQGDACFYTPDFRVLLNDGTIEFHEIKGFMKEDANIKIKWFVQQHPYPLVIVRWINGHWEYDRLSP